MVKMVSLKRTKQDKQAEKSALGRPGIASADEGDGAISIHLEPHHLDKLGVGGGLRSGHKVTLHGEGTVDRAESFKDGDGKVKQRATLKLHKAGLEYTGSDIESDKHELRGEIERAGAKKASKGDMVD